MYIPFPIGGHGVGFAGAWPWINFALVFVGIFVIAFLLVTKLLPYVKKLVEENIGERKEMKPLVALASVLILVRAAEFVVRAAPTRYVSFLNTWINALDNMLGAVTWLIMVSILLIIAISIFRLRPKQSE